MAFAIHAKPVHGQHGGVDEAGRVRIGVHGAALARADPVIQPMAVYARLLATAHRVGREGGVVEVHRLNATHRREG